jgi:hypothetical protein
MQKICNKQEKLENFFSLTECIFNAKCSSAASGHFDQVDLIALYPNGYPDPENMALTDKARSSLAKITGVPSKSPHLNAAT